MPVIMNFSNGRKLTYSYALPYGAALKVESTLYKKSGKRKTLMTLSMNRVPWESDTYKAIKSLVRYFLYLFPELKESPYSNMMGGYKWESPALPISEMLSE